ncbi:MULTISPECIES: DNA-directed RNA polymerase subunit beta [Oceanobacillus]|uniref:DNA-directed RNA polymerase subunit beta n=1 Tax=Oceanobacillus indicireducens TaxID=1004261 RepID=A0A917XSV7_9BACI|nr:MULTISPECIES: DNA-directed RNA polymerase subunit beta [Oceanobacillus]GGN50085.1 hypothetical protein GCM10007971_03250 [Oceanobacillus indicireducens]
MSTKQLRLAGIGKKQEKSSEAEDKKLNKRAKKAELAAEKKQSKAKSPETKEQQRRSEQRDKQSRVRIFPIWLRIIIVAILAVFALVAGLMIGYGIIGDGTPTDALKVETWQHIIDIVTKE